MRLHEMALGPMVRTADDALKLPMSECLIYKTQKPDKGGKAMRRFTRTVCIIGFALAFILPTCWHANAQDSVGITDVFTTDLAGTPKTAFHPGDNVRYHVAFDLSVVEKTKVVARGKARGQKTKKGGEEGSFKTDLEKQKQRLESGTHTFS